MITENDFYSLIGKVADKIPANKYDSIYPILRGGFYFAVELGKILKLPIVYKITENTLIVDDLIDSGKTLSKYSNDKAVLLVKNNKEQEVNYFADKVEGWVDFFWETSDDKKDLIVRQLQCIGENPDREGLKETPKRVINMWNELYKGYNKDLMPKITTFKNGSDGIVYNEMIIDTGSYYSQCEHHMLPFFGEYHFAYIPNEKGLILGLSKVARIVDFYSAKLQIQERLVSEIVEALWQELSKDENPPVGMALVMTGEHLCKTMRGARKKGKMTTSYLKGAFKENIETRNEFLKLIK